MEKIFEKEKRSTLPGQVANQIREAIKSGKLKPGDRLIETVLAREMNIGRNAVREAIRYIEKEGLIVTTPFKGAQVVEMSQIDLKDIYDVRNALETLALNTLAEKIDNEKRGPRSRFVVKHTEIHKIYISFIFFCFHKFPTIT